MKAKNRQFDPRQHSSLVVDGLKNAPARAMLRAVGFTDADFTRPQVGIASTWANLTPCNMHIDTLAREAVAGADAAGGKGVLFNTITVSDGISMGSPGMRYSLVSREVIADSIETVVGAEGFDGFVAIGGCDKNIPACAMAIARLNRPAVFVYGGTIRPGAGHTDIVSVFEAVGARASGKVDDATVLQAAAVACTPRTPWLRQSKHWGFHCPTAQPRKQWARASSPTAAVLAKPSCTC
jgi:dihydroxy-acid dehydratase